MTAGGEVVESNSIETVDTLNGRGIRKQTWHKDHSRKYRANVGEKFHQLSRVLCEVAGKDDMNVRFKSEILETALKLVRELNEDVSMLEVEVAMSSRKFLMEWIERCATNAEKPSQALQPLYEIICRKRGWKYVELWEKADLESNIIEIGMTNHIIRGKDSVERDIKSFSRRSSSILFTPGVGLVGRVWSSMRGELVSDVCDPSIYLRANLAMCKGISSSIAVPVVVLGKTAVVVLFYDTDPRYDFESLRLAESIAASIGMVCGAKKGRLPAEAEPLS